MRRVAEQAQRLWIERAVKPTVLDSPAPPRAQRLAQEARNCLTIAVGHGDVAFTAELIDEAVKLAQRARELSKA
jgi:hypothetical protein